MTDLQPCRCHAIPRVERKETQYIMNIGLFRDTVSRWSVVCDNCGNRYGDFQSREAAVNGWNRYVKSWQNRRTEP